MMKMTDDQIKEKLILAGVKNLSEFGYPHANSDNIFKDEVYSQFFKSMLVANRGVSTKRIDCIIESMIIQIDAQNF